MGLGSVAALVLAGVAFVGVLPAAADTLTFSPAPPPTSTAGAVLASFGVTGGTSGATMTISSGCNLSGTTAGTVGGGGSTTFNAVTINTAGSCTLTATETGSGTGTVTSASITVSTGTPTQLVFTTAPPATAGAGVVLTTSPVVKVEDASGNVISSGTDSGDMLTMTSSNCKLGGTIQETASAGVATFNALTITQTGAPCYLAATDATNSAIHPTPFAGTTVSGGTPIKLVFTVPPPASVLTTGTAIASFQVSVEDASGYIDTGSNPGSTDTIAITSPCITGTFSQVASNGVATFSNVSFGTTGNCVITATDTTRSTSVTASTATVSVGQAQAAVTITTKSGYLDAPLTLAATGGTGTGAVTFTVVGGTATGCSITSGVLRATKGGTCIVTATKAAVAPYSVGVSAATTVTISSAPKALRLVGIVAKSRTTSVTVTGYNFSGRPKVISNVPGFKGLVTRDTGKSLTIRVTVKASSARPGVKTLALTFANGAHAAVRYSLH